MSENYLAEYQLDRASPLPKDADFLFYTEAEKMPQDLALYISKDTSWTGFRSIKLSERIYLIGRKKLNVDDFLTIAYLKTDDSELSMSVNSYLNEAFEPILWAVIVTFVLSIFMIVYMTLKFIRPLRDLNEWTAQLNENNKIINIPNFKFEELNELASTLAVSLNENLRLIEKDKFFLRAASHELRTPISVSSVNIELMNMYLEVQHVSPKLTVPLLRIENAVKDMQQLSETLLWLDHDGGSSIETTQFDLKSTIHSIVSDSRYLLTNKNVDIAINCVNANITCNFPSFKIVLGNIVRNAMQYTNNGRIEINLDERVALIKNVDANETPISVDNSDYGYGLGLILVEKICNKGSWKYSTRNIVGGREVQILFK
ncbi:HAMP domain-containing sensor histidine kinase [Glaciecola sp. 33A]|uniref:sensor histidine kinase n=1 Tax=Glaciecola sp. 33A TaxID=2057807 RepID=UPI000C32CF98|nr:HAMP domain-containing sensor histidine kinase [Glaciecola sp. 33A]PKI00364.1 sensor histidine kinase [Glaciecola sp. 33A]